LWGAEGNAVVNLYGDGTWGFRLLGGVRYLDLDERLQVARFSNDFGGLLCSPANPNPPLGNAEPAGSTLANADSFHTRDQFSGGQLGATAQVWMGGGLSVQARALVALGTTHQTIDVGGTTTQTTPGQGPVAFPGGALAVPSNSGHFGRDAFSVIPEGEVRVNYQVSERLCIFAGYDFLYWGNVVRPGNQVNLSVDERAIPIACPFTPGFRATLSPPSFNESSFWAQGVSLGVELHF
jgi:hypothetical protein